MENLEDFRYYFADEKEIDAFVATEEALKDPEQRLQVAKARRVWTADRQNGCAKRTVTQFHRWQSSIISLRGEPSGKSKYRSGSGTR